MIALPLRRVEATEAPVAPPEPETPDEHARRIAHNIAYNKTFLNLDMRAYKGTDLEPLILKRVEEEYQKYTAARAKTNRPVIPLLKGKKVKKCNDKKGLAVGVVGGEEEVVGGEVVVLQGEVVVQGEVGGVVEGVLVPHSTGMVVKRKPVKPRIPLIGGQARVAIPKALKTAEMAGVELVPEVREKMKASPAEVVSDLKRKRKALIKLSI